MYKIIAIGDAVMDTHVQVDEATLSCDVNHQNCQLCFDYAEKIPITGSFQAIGGNAVNVSVGVEKLGIKSAILSTIGNDANGKQIVSQLKKDGVDVGLIKKDNKTDTRYSVVLNFKGERTILSYHKKRNYFWPKKMPSTDWIYYTSLSEGFEPVQEELIKFLDAHPTVRLAVNPGSYQMTKAMGSVKEIVKRADLLIVNLQEAEKIINSTLEKEKTMNAIIHKILMLGPKEVAITDACRGAWAGNSEEIWHMDSLPVKVVAKTGAGDAFSSGYLSARCYGHGAETALSWGIANSCAVISEFGAQKGLLDQKGIKKMLANYANIVPKSC